MRAIAIPETTYKLLNAVRSTVGTSETQNVRRVVIRGEGRDGGIEYLPVKPRWTSAAIERAGISDLVQRYSFQRTRPAVAAHFRPGVYDVSGLHILVIK